MRINNLAGLLILAMIFSFCFNLMGTGAENSANGISMKVSGKVIQRETVKGIPGVRIDILDIITGESYDGTTDRNGNFVIRMVPQGIYEISEVDIHMTCPEELIIDQMPETITVNLGKNILNLNVYLKKGATISGYVYTEDGVTPLEGAEIVSDPWIYGKNESVFTNWEGKYVIKGVGEGDKLIHASAVGFADESIGFDVKLGETFENINFILGEGNVSVAGKIISSTDNQAIKNASVFFIYYEANQQFSAGWTKTYNNGVYHIIGLKHPGTFKLNINHKEYESIDSEFIELIMGENILNIKLEALSDLSEMGLARNAPKSAAAGSGTSNTQSCDCYKKDYDFDQFQKQACQDLQQNKDCIKGLRASEIKECFEYRCKNRNYKIKCIKECKKSSEGYTCAYVYRVNIKNHKSGTIRICMNNAEPSRCDFKKELPRILLHELYHLCDKNASRNRSSCNEYRDYRDMFCMFKYPSDKNQRDKYEKYCQDCVRKGRNCNK